MINLRLLAGSIAVFPKNEWIDVLVVFWIIGAFNLILKLVPLFITTAFGILIVEVLVDDR